MKNLRFKERLKDLKRLKEEQVFRLCFDIFFFKRGSKFYIERGAKMLVVWNFLSEGCCLSARGGPKKMSA